MNVFTVGKTSQAYFHNRRSANRRHGDFRATRNALISFDYQEWVRTS